MTAYDMRISDWSSDVCSSDLEELPALVGLEVVLHPEALTSGVDPHVGVRAVAVHVAPRSRQAPVAHDVRDLVRRLRVGGPEVPLHVVVSQTGVGQALLRPDEVRELHRVAHRSEEHTSELQSLMRISYAVFCLKKKK